MPHRIALFIVLMVACSKPTPAPTSVVPQSEGAPSTSAGTEAALAKAESLLGERTACLVIANADGTAALRTDETRCAKRLRPFSTFKIPNSLIGLELGLLTDATTVVRWSREAYPPQDWWPAIWTSEEHTLRSAFRYSHVPYFRTLATQIGSENMSKFVAQFEYGNRTISGNLDSFWLDGDIAISADEQIEFLHRFYNERLGVSEHSTAVVKDIFVREQALGATLSAKTGTGERDDGGTLAWLVGYVEQGDDVHYFALNIESDGAEPVNPEWRIAIIKDVMGELGFWQAR